MYTEGKPHTTANDDVYNHFPKPRDTDSKAHQLLLTEQMVSIHCVHVVRKLCVFQGFHFVTSGLGILLLKSNLYVVLCLHSSDRWPSFVQLSMRVQLEWMQLYQQSFPSSVKCC